jgi:hypothetical protein
MVFFVVLPALLRPFEIYLNFYISNLLQFGDLFYERPVCLLTYVLAARVLPGELFFWSMLLSTFPMLRYS